MSLALPICELYISLMESVNDAQFLKIISLFLLFVAATVPVFATVIVPVIGIYILL